MRIVKKGTMLVKPESRPGEREHKVGDKTLWLPEAGTGIAKGLDVERRQGEWWPHKAEVLSSADNIVYGVHETGEEVWSINSDYDIRMAVRPQHIRLIQPTIRKSWRVPMAGDTAHFGNLTLNPATFYNGNVSVNIHDAYCITPADGSGVWAVGPWALLEQIPEMPSSSEIITSISQREMLGHGVVRMVGGGFQEMHPSIEVGSVVAFMVYGGANTTIENPIEGGQPLVPILPEYVVGVDSNGISDEELQSMRDIVAAKQAEIAKALEKIAAIKVESEEDRQKRLIAEQEESHYALARKETSKNWVRHHRKL